MEGNNSRRATGSGGVRRMKMRELRQLEKETQLMKAFSEEKAAKKKAERKLQQTPEEMYYELDWEMLPSEIRDAYEVLGFDEVSWEEGGAVTDGMEWDELSPQQQEAALFIGYTSEDYEPFWAEMTPEKQNAYTALGYSEEIWNEGGVVVTDEMAWADLSQEQKDAATFLQYTEQEWNDERGIVSTEEPTNNVSMMLKKQMQHWLHPCPHYLMSRFFSCFTANENTN